MLHCSAAKLLQQPLCVCVLLGRAAAILAGCSWDLREEEEGGDSPQELFLQPRFLLLLSAEPAAWGALNTHECCCMSQGSAQRPEGSWSVELLWCCQCPGAPSLL